MFARLLIALACLAVTAGADGQERGDFELGVEALESGDTASAEVHFRDAYEASPTDLIQLNWADSLLRLGRAREAAELLEPLAVGSADLLIRDAARDLEEQARSRLGSIRVLVASDDDVSIRVDGRDVRGGRVTVDAGERTIEVHRNNERIHTQTLAVEAGEAVDFRVPTNSGHAVPAAALHLDPPSNVRRRRRRIGLAIAGAVIAAGLVSIAIASAGGDERESGNVAPVDLWGSP